MERLSLALAPRPRQRRRPMQAALCETRLALDRLPQALLRSVRAVQPHEAIREQKELSLLGHGPAELPQRSALEERTARRDERERQPGGIALHSEEGECLGVRLERGVERFGDCVGRKVWVNV